MFYFTSKSTLIILHSLFISFSNPFNPGQSRLKFLSFVVYFPTNKLLSHLFTNIAISFIYKYFQFLQISINLRKHFQTGVLEKQKIKIPHLCPIIENTKPIYPKLNHPRIPINPQGGGYPQAPKG